MSFGRKVFEANSVRPGDGGSEAQVQGVDDEEIEAEACEETRRSRTLPCRAVRNRNCTC